MNIDLQSLFYIVGIITMITWLALLLVILLIMWRIKRVIEKLKSATFVIDKIRKFFKR